MLIALLILFVSVVLHEVMHGLVAYRLGDPTAKLRGRLSLNPLVHIDPLGSILLPILFIVSGSHMMLAWAKPVPVNPAYFKDPVKDMMRVAIAGPLLNITLAFLCGTILRFAVLPALFSNALTVAVEINLLLALFNLIPIPPLDGSRVLAYFLPLSLRLKLDAIEPYGFVILFLLLYFDLISKPLFWTLRFLLNTFQILA